MRSSIIALCFVLCITIETVLGCAPAPGGNCLPGCPGLPYPNAAGTQCVQTSNSGSSGQRPNPGAKRDTPNRVVSEEARTTGYGDDRCPNPENNLVCRLVTNEFVDCDCCNWNIDVEIGSDSICLVGGDCYTDDEDAVVSCCRVSPRDDEDDVCNEKLLWDNAWGTGPLDYYQTGGTLYWAASEGGSAYLASEAAHTHTWHVAVDGDDSTYYDAAVTQGGDCLVGFDFKRPVTVAAAKYKIRPYSHGVWGSRYAGHKVEGSNDKVNWHLLGTVGTAGATKDSGHWNYVPLTTVAVQTAYRYLRFHGDNMCNWAELEFDGCYQTCWDFDFPAGVEYGTWSDPKCLTHDGTVPDDGDFCPEDGDYKNPGYGSEDDYSEFEDEAPHVAGYGTRRQTRRRFDEASPVQQMYEKKDTIRRDIL